MSKEPTPSSSRQVEREAVEWLARRDRGLAAAEQDAYLQWLRENPSHAAALARHEATLRRMRKLAHWEPAYSSEPNPDLFARPRRRWWRALAPLTAVAAAAALAAFFWPRPAINPAQPLPARDLLRVNERQALPDGSMVELRDGSRIDVAFSARERRVRLLDGEAQFSVNPDPSRPFIVEAAAISVRALGTVFAVRLDAAAVDVLVTEGKVRVESTPLAGAVSSASEAPIVPAQHRATVALGPAAPEPQVTQVTPEQIKMALAWQAPRFQFYETPLSEALDEFNRRNRLQLVAGDAAVGAMRIGGTFRADNVEGFVDLLQLTLNIRSERRNEAEIVLRSPR